MFSNILVPVDMNHLDHLQRALEVAAGLGGHYGAPVHYVGVTAETPTAVAHNPDEFAARMREFAAGEAERYGITAEGHGYPSHDPAIDLNKTLLKAVDDIGADLVVMASHIPNIADHLWTSHGGYLASHAHVSVFIVRTRGGQ